MPEPRPPFDWSLAPPGERVLVALSGGGDSMAMLLALWQSKHDIVAAHINHGLRGAESDADEAFVRKHCARLDIPLVVERVELKARDGHVHEATARTARYESLIRIAREQGCSRVATGHTSDDSLETVLLNWLRGAAVTGLRGIPAQRQLAPDLWLVRPLLGASREEVRAACTAAGWEWREDSSNESSSYLRNRVRNELLPTIAGVIEPQRTLPQLARQTARAAEILEADLDYLDDVATATLAAITLREEGKLIALDGLAFRGLHLALQRRVMRAAVRRLEGEVRDLDFEQVEVARRHIVADGRRAVWQWRRGLNVEWTGAMAGNRIRLWLVSRE